MIFLVIIKSGKPSSKTCFQKKFRDTVQLSINVMLMENNSKLFIATLLKVASFNKQIWHALEII